MPLRIRLITSLAVALALSVAFGGVLTGWHVARSVGTELATALDVGRQAVRNELDELPGSTDPGRELRRLVSTFDGDRHVRASLLDASGASLAESRLLAPAQPAPGWFLALVAPVLAPFDLPVGAGAGDAVAIRLEADPVSEVAEAWGEVYDAALVLASFCVLTLLATSWTVGRALRPVTGILAGLSRIGSGDYRARVAKAGPPEIAALADGFNRMAARLAEIHAQNARLQEQLLTLQEEERADISRDLHDEIGPSLFAATMNAATIQHLVETGRADEIPEQARAIQDAAAHVQRHVKDLLRRLRPVHAVAFGLRPAINELVAFWRGRHPNIAFSVSLLANDADLDERLKETLYRIIQEGMANAVRHGQPSRVEIVVEDGPESIVAEVNDDGEASASLAKPGFGLTGMRERVAALGGTLAIGLRERGPGWAIVARLPKAPEAPLSAAQA